MSMRSSDHILHAGIVAGSGVAEVGRRLDRFAGKLRLLWTRWGQTRVRPDSSENAGWITGGLTAVAVERADRHALAVLRHGIRPGSAPGPAIEALENRRLAARIAGPLQAPQHQVDLRHGLDANATHAAMVVKIAGC